MAILDIDTYTLFLHLHSVVRWLSLGLAVIVTVKSLAGWLGNMGYTKFDNILGASYVGSMDLMLLLGLVLYIFLSPITKAAFSDFGAAMSNSSMRFWAVEHITLMIGSIAVAHVGRSKSKKATEAKRKYKLQSILFSLSLLLMLLGMPWDRF